MSRFKPTEGTFHRSRSGTAAIVTPGVPQPIISLAANPNFAEVSSFTLPQRIGLIALCVFILTSAASDITLQVLKAKTYLSWISYPFLIPTFAFSGRMLRGLEFKTGKYWLGFLVFAVLGIPVSYWPHASLELMTNYFIRCYILFFLICAFVEDYAQCLRFIYANIIGAVLLLISCFFLGGTTPEGRFIIPGSYLFNNANDLALSLLFGIGYFTYLAQKPGIFGRAVGVLGAVASLFYMLRTASRGGLVAFVVFLAVLIIFSRRSIVLIAATIPIVILSFIFMPSNTLHRLSLIFLKPNVYQAQGDEDISTIESQIQRTALLQKALQYTFRHPLLGVGAGQFTNAVWADEHKIGKHPPALGTHNTYLEVSSECGLPAFFCYTAVVLACIRINYQTCKKARLRPELADIARLSYCLCATNAGFAVNIFFHHITYTVTLPLLAGITVCLGAVVDGAMLARPTPEAVNVPALGKRPLRVSAEQGRG